MCFLRSDQLFTLSRPLCPALSFADVDTYGIIFDNSQAIHTMDKSYRRDRQISVGDDDDHPLAHHLNTDRRTDRQLIPVRLVSKQVEHTCKV